MIHPPIPPSSIPACLMQDHGGLELVLEAKLREQGREHPRVGVSTPHRAPWHAIHTHGHKPITGHTRTPFTLTFTAVYMAHS